MNRYIYFFAAIILIFLSSCSKTTVIDEENIDCIFCTDTLFKHLDTLWTAERMTAVTGEYLGLFSDGDLVIFAGSTYTGTFAYAHDKETGQQIWHWEETDQVYDQAVQGNNSLIFQSASKIMRLDLQSGTTIQTYVPIEGSIAHSAGQLLGDYYYYTEKSADDSTFSIVRSPIAELQTWETVYTLKRGEETGGTIPHIRSYNLWINPESGEHFLIFQLQMSSTPRVDVIAWNLSKNEKVWHQKDISPNELSSLRQIQIINDKAYFSTRRTMYCFEVQNGNLLWQYDHIPNVLGMTMLNPVYAKSEGTLIIKDESGNLFSLDAESGQRRWLFDQRGLLTSYAGSPVYHDGVVYYTAGRLRIANAATGEEILEQRASRNDSDSFQGELAVDSDRGMVYAASREKIFAIKAKDAK